jgi:hypothetical protein
MGTPEFREFTTTSEWMEYRHGLAVEEDIAWQERKRIEATAQKLRDTFVTAIIGPGPATATDPMIWCRDWRQRYAPDHPLRMDYEESIHGKSPEEIENEDLIGLEHLHEASLRVIASRL